MDEAIETIEYKGYEIKVYPDEMPESPREWDNLFTMTCFHGRYELGDKHDLTSDMFSGWQEIKTYLIERESAYITYPLYLYDHSGLRIKVGSFHGLLPQGHAEFDSGKVGYIWTTRERLVKRYGVKRISKKTRERALRVMQNEVETYDQFLSGQVYGFVIEKDGEDMDSCWGFFGDPNEYMIPECKRIVEWLANEAEKKQAIAKAVSSA